MTNITFIFETSPNTNPKEKKVGGHGILYPPPEKVGRHVPCIPHQIAPMRLIMTLVQITNYTSLNYTDPPKWIYTVLKIFSPFTIYEQLALALKKQSCPEIFHCIEYTFHIEDFNNLRLPWKQSFPWNFSLYWVYFLPFRIFEQLCACPEKQSCLEFTVLIIYFLSLRIFEQLALGLKNRVALIFSLY